MLDVLLRKTSSSSSIGMIVATSLASQLGGMSPEASPSSGPAKIQYSGSERTLLANESPFETIATKMSGFERGHNPLVLLIEQTLATAIMETEFRATADAAFNDAKLLVTRNRLPYPPTVSVSDEGILALQWQRRSRGVMLVFAGDGEASLAFWRPGQLYAQNGIESPVSEPLPRVFYAELNQVFA